MVGDVGKFCASHTRLSRYRPWSPADIRWDVADMDGERREREKAGATRGVCLLSGHHNGGDGDGLRVGLDEWVPAKAPAH